MKDSTPLQILSIPVEGRVEILTVTSGQMAAELHRLVGGYFECHQLADGLCLWLNEDGKGMGLPWNPAAQGLWDLRWGIGTDAIVGNAVVTGGADRDGDTEGLSPELIDILAPFIHRTENAGR